MEIQEGELRVPPDGGAGDEDPKPVNRYCVLIFQHQQTLTQPLTARLRRELGQTVTSPPELTEIDVWLDSPGGDAHAAFKLGILLRSHAAKVRVVIPDYAKSAATLLTLVADEIFMAPAAELGPLDAQINFEQEGMTISALDRVRSLDDLVNVAMNIGLSGGVQVMGVTRLSRTEALNTMLDFSAKFLAPVVGKLDPIMLHWSQTLLTVAREYGQRLLATRQGDLANAGKDIPDKLLENYPTHGFVIDLREAAELGLPVQPILRYDYHDFIKAVHDSFEANPTDQYRVFDLVQAGRREPDGTQGNDEGHAGDHESDAGRSESDTPAQEVLDEELPADQRDEDRLGEDQPSVGAS